MLFGFGIASGWQNNFVNENIFVDKKILLIKTHLILSLLNNNLLSIKDMKGL